MILSRNGKVLPVEMHNGTPVLPDDICLKLIDEIEQRKREAKRQVKGKEPEDDIELQSIWPHLSKVLNWLVENNVEEAVDILDLIIQKRRRELQRESPEVDVTDALKSTIMSFIREGV